MKRIALLLLALLGLTSASWAEASEVKTVHDAQGWKLQVDGEDLAVKGIVWSFTPVGENYGYNLFAQTDAVITKVIDTDMVLIQAMGANAIRCFSTIPPKWVEYIYDRYGVYTMVNDLFGRYGITVDGRWQNPTDYSNPETRKALLAQAKKTFETYKDTRGVLMYMLGNESNYGLQWTSNQIENLPGGERDSFKANALYSLFEEAFKLGKSIDKNHPMGLINGDLQYLRVMKDLVPDLDILGVNTYRGAQSYDGFYQSIAKDLGRPFVYTEFGADAYNVATEQEDQDAQARIVLSQWKELYGQTYGKGKSANCLGGFVFEWMDEWWKAGMEVGLTVHDTNGTWNNGGYSFDSMAGRNNMNEEWFGIVGQSLHTVDGVPRRLPRAAYFALKDLWKLDLYTSTKDDIAEAFANLDTASAVGRGNALAQFDNSTDPLPLFTPHGSVMSRAFWKGDNDGWASTKTQSLDPSSQYTLMAGGSFRTAEKLTGSFQVRLRPSTLANDGANDLFDPVESAGKTDAANSNNYSPLTPVELYQATVDYQSSALTATFHYHDGHPDWAAEGDFFGFLPEAYDLYHMDKDGSVAPFGVELSSPDLVPGLKIWAGPELYWGASPRVMAKYSAVWGRLGLNLVHDEEIGLTDADRDATATMAMKTADRWTEALVSFLIHDGINLETGAMLGQYNRANDAHRTYSKVVGQTVTTGLTYTLADATAAKARLTLDSIPYLRMQFQYLYAGLLADTKGAMQREGSQLADVGSGNRQEAKAMVMGTYGDWSLRTTGLWREPLVAPLGDSVSGLAVRDPLHSDFTVWDNRAALQGEALLTWDRTGATYFHDWNNVDREDSPLSASLGLLYNFHLGPTDATVYYSELGVRGVLDAGLPAVDGTWSLQSRIAGRPLPGVRLALNATAGKMQSTGKDTRLVQFWQAGGQASVDRLIFDGSYASDAWGPQGWYREFNITYPVQWSAGIAYSLKPVSFLSENDRVGLKFSSRDYGSHATNTELLTGHQSVFAAELYAGWSF